MRYTLINGLLLLAVSPFSALALPVDPNDYNLANQNENQNQNQGQYNSPGVYDKANPNENQWRDQSQSQAANPNQADQNQNLRRSMGAQPFGASRANPGVPGLHTRNWPNQNNQNSQGWTDKNGQWHPNNQNQNGQGWTDANGQWHANNQGQKGQGWTDQNGQWHANQKRDWRDNDYNRNEEYNRDDSHHNDHHREGYLDRAADRAADDILSSRTVAARWWPFSNWNHNDRNRDCDRDDSNCRNRDHHNDDYGYDDKCKSDDPNDRSGWSCRHDWNRSGATPTPRAVVARHSPHDNNDINGVNDAAATPAVQDNNGVSASATPTAQHGVEQKYNKDQDQENNQNLDKDLKHDERYE